MLVVKANHLGMCFGVKDALEYARQLESPGDVTIHGELVHNPQVKSELRKRGFHESSEEGRGTSYSTPEVMVTAHGISHREKAELERAGHRIHDTTCPLVRRVHKAALRFHRLGYFLVVIGKADHVEVLGLTGDLERFTVVSNLDQVTCWAHGKIAVVNQTTTRPAELKEFHVAIQRLNPTAEVELVDTICKPTKDRQTAATELLDRVEALVVVGGHNSNNTRQLGLQAEARGLPWLHVESSEELDPGWFSGKRLVGLTAGTSTPDEVIDEVYRALVRMSVPRTACA